VERCSTPRRGLEAPDPINLIFKEKMGIRVPSDPVIQADVYLACPFRTIENVGWPGQT